MRLKVWISVVALLFCGGIFTVKAQPLADIGLYGNGGDTLEVRLIPRGFFNGVASNVVFTLRWESGCNTSLGNIAQSGAPASYLPMAKSGIPISSNGYSYQVFGGIGLIPMSSAGGSWSNGVPVTLMKIPVSNPKGTFQIVNDSWTNALTNNGDFFVSLNGVKKTGVIFQSNYSFVQSGSVSICQGDSILLGGIYRKLPGVYQDVVQTQGGCDSIVSVQLSLLPSFFNSFNISICEGESFFAGGSLQTQSGTYYDTLFSNSGCDTIIVTNLTVLPNSNITNNVSICSGQSYFAGGALQTTSGIYYDNFTAANGCDSIITTVLTVNSNQTASISPASATICIGQSATLSVNSGISYSWSTGATTNNITVFPSSTTSYSVTVTYAGGCTASASRIVVVNSNPTVLISPATISICSGHGAILLASGGTAYSWSTGSVNSGINVTPPSTTIYTVTVTNASGCTASASRTVNVNPSPIAAVTPSSTTICNGQSASLTASGGTFYSWNSGANTANINVNPGSNTGYTVTVTASNGCTSTASGIVNVNVNPSADISPATVNICNGNSATLTASGGTSYSWNTGETVANISVNPSATASYSVTVANSAGCTASTSRLVTVNAGAAAAITPPNPSICNGSSATLIASGGSFYSWSTGSTTSVIMVSPASTTSYTVTVTHASGCSAVVSATVTVSGSISASISPANPYVCNGQGTTLTANGGTSYSWNTGAATPSISVNPSTATAYSVTVTDGGLCSATASTVVLVNSLPTASISPPSVSICAGQSAALTASGGTSYSWNTGSLVANLNVSPVSTTAYSVTVSNSVGCTATTSRTVTVNALPIAVISPAQPIICTGENITLTASGGTSYSWNNSALTPAIMVSPDSSLNYSVTVTNTSNCSATTSQSVIVNQKKQTNVNAAICQGESYFAGGRIQTTSGTYYDTLLTSNNCDSIIITTLSVYPVHSITVSVSICQGENYFAGGSFRTVSGIYFDTLATTHGCDSIIITQLDVKPVYTVSVNVSICQGQNYFAAGALRTIAGNYFDTLTASNGCDSIIVTYLTVNPNPVASIAPVAPICSGSTATLIASGGISYTWSNGANTASINVSPVTSANYIVTVTNANGCTATASRIVAVNSPPNALISPATVSICSGKSAILAAGGGTNYSWSTGALTSSITVNPLFTTTYSVTVANTSGCTASVSRVVNVNPVPAPVISPATVSICTGNSATLTAGGGVAYSWSTGAISAAIAVSPVTTSTYSVTATNGSGCTASLSRVVTVYPKKFVSLEVTICQGASHFAGGALQTLPGTYRDTFITPNSCDSIVTTYLFVVPAIVQTQDIASCRGESVFAGGELQTLPGTYYDTLVADGGCDSIVVTHLTFIEDAGTTLDIMIHSGSSYFAGGALRYVGGTYYDTLQAANSCDSIVTTLLSVENIEYDITVNEIENTLTIRTSLEKDFADNTYGATAVGWSIPRTLDSLMNSDHLEWALYDANGTKKLDFKVDYFSQTNQTWTGYGSLGISGGDGTIVTGSDSAILHTSTSLGENFNNLGYVLTTNSPPTDTNYSVNPQYPGWIYEIWYEAKIKLDVFGAVGYGYHDVVSVHASPDKDDVPIFIDADSLIPPICPRSEIRDVIICEGDSFWAGGSYHTTRGTYYDTLNLAGCDIYTISQLTVLPRSVTVIDEIICQGESIMAGGAVRTLSGTYYDTLQAASGCDSVVITHLLVNPVYSIVNNISICEGEGYLAQGEMQTESGIYTDTFLSSLNCDSVIVTHLSVIPASTTISNISACDGDNVFAGGNFQTESGIYYDTLTNASGCDSVILTNLTLYPVKSVVLNASICEGGSYFAAGAAQTESGIYYDTLSTANACDSIVTTSLNVLPVKIENIEVSICNGESYFAGGANRNASGIYYDSLIAYNGCDSVVITHLTVNPVYNSSVSISICSGESYFAQGTNQTSSGTYYDTLFSQSGCDSIIVTNLTVVPVILLNQNISICNGESVFLEGDYQDSPGTYYDTLIAGGGCDSIIITELDFYPQPVTSLNINICPGENYFAGGANQMFSGIYYDTVLSQHGCDSIVITHLNILPIFSFTRNVSICAGKSFVAGGIPQQAAGVYYDTLIANNGCDSLIITNLSVLPISIIHLNASICAGENYFAGGSPQTSQGIYTDTLTSANGCDSIIVTHLSVLPHHFSTRQATICAGDSFYAGGAYQKSTGIYYDTLVAANGCDSITATTLEVEQSISDIRNVSICAGDSYFAGGTFRNQSGVFYDTLMAASGCDSIVITYLTVTNVITALSPVTICSDESYFAQGAYRSTPGLYYDTLTASSGCDSIRITVLNVLPVARVNKFVTICEGETYFTGGSWRSTPGIYQDTLTANNGCDSIVVTQLIILPVKSTAVAVSICSNENYFAGSALRNISGTYYDTLFADNGCDSIVTTFLTVKPAFLFNQAITICDKDSFFAGGQFRQVSGVYSDSFTTVSGCDSVLVTSLTVHPTHHINQEVHICIGDQLYVGGAFQNSSGIYNDTFVNRFGCDSIVTTQLIVETPIETVFNISICPGDSLLVGRFYHHTPGTYYDTLPAIGLCDSLITVHLTIANVPANTVTAEICANDSFLAGGNYQNLPGTYYDTLVSSLGCDSILITELSVLPISTTLLSVSICEGESYFAQGSWQSAAGIYYDTLTAANGCDSVVISSLLVLPRSYSDLNVSICEGESYFAGGALRSVSGDYADTLVAANGCDSIITTHLSVRQNHFEFYPVTICSGQGYFAEGEDRTTSGVYTDSMVDRFGCDSVVTTVLNVLPPFNRIVNASICDDEQYFAGGAYQNVSGVYHDSFTTASGCDSIVTTLLTVSENQVLNQTISICNSDSIFLQGAFRKENGLYRDDYLTASGCDSIVLTNLIVKPEKQVILTVFICQGSSVFAGGQLRNVSGVYFDTLVAANGCDSVITTLLTVHQTIHLWQHVNICRGESHFAGGELRTVSGTYHDTLTTFTGCDSIITTFLTVLPTHSRYYPVQICQGESHFAAGAYQTQTGLYLDTLPAANGCDSIVLTILNVLPSKFDTVEATICADESYFAGGELRNISGVYIDTLIAFSGCDSILTTHLEVLPASIFHRIVSICDGDSIYLAGRFRNQAGAYFDTLTASNGCDSILTTQLEILNHALEERTVSICNGESFFTGGTLQFAAGDYFDTLAGSNGCDSILITHLFVETEITTVVPVSICNGEQYFAGGEWQSSPGNYFDTLTSSGGCDSLIITQLTVKPRYSSASLVEICSDETYYAGGAYRNTSGLYYDTLAAINGCDSLVITQLHIKPDFTFTQAMTICSGEGYFAQGALQTTTGTYRDTLVSSLGCDSVIVTLLNVLPVKTTTLNIAICSGETHFAQGAFQNQTGTYYDTLFAANGCDSIITTQLIVLPHRASVANVEICSGESYFAQGALRYTAGTYLDILTAANGCDSMVTTYLTVKPLSFTSIHATICYGESYLAGGTSQTASGIYYDTLPAANGCDSIVTTHLVALPLSTETVSVSVCDGESYFAGGALRNSAGSYFDTLPASNGCDSVITTMLSILPENLTSLDISICLDETYFAGGAVQNSPGTYIDTFENRFGCDSIIITRLNVYNLIEETVFVTICEGGSYFAGGTLQTQSGTYTDVLVATNGCDSTVITQLTVLQKYHQTNSLSICSNDSVFLQGAYRHLPGIYIDTLTAANGCDSILTTLLALRASIVHYQYFTICAYDSAFAGGSYRKSSGIYYDTLIAQNGCDSVIVTTLTVLSSVPSDTLVHEVCEGEGVFIRGIFRTVDGIYQDTLTALNGCDSIVNNILMVHPLPAANAGTDGSICEGGSTLLNASGGDGYVWSTGDTTAYITVAPFQTTSYFVFVSSREGCYAADTVTVVVNPLPSVSFSGLNSTYCTNFENILLTGSPAAGTFSGPGVIGNIFNPGLAQVGNHPIIYSYTDASGCSSSSSQLVTVTALQSATFTGLDSSYCIETASHLLAGVPAGGTFSGPGISNNTFVPFYAGVGVHAIYYRHVSSGGCVSADTQFVRVLALPAINFQFSDSIFCISDQPLTLVATPTGGIFTGAGVTGSTFTPSVAGIGNTHPISYSYTDANGCNAIVTRSVAVKSNPNTVITPLSSGFCFSHGEVALSGTPAGGLFTGTGVSNNLFNTIDAGAGAHILSYSYTDSFNCSSTSITLVNVFDNPIVNLSGLNNEYCADATPVNLSGSPVGGLYNGAGVVVNIFDAKIAGVGGPYPITYYYEDARGCDASDTQWVVVNPLPELSIDRTDFTFCLHGAAIELPGTPYGGVFNGPGISNNVFTPSQAGLGTHSIIYTYTDSNNCRGSLVASVTIQVCTGIDAQDGLEGIAVFPNPFEEQLTMQISVTSHSTLQLRFTDIFGRTIFSNAAIQLQPGLNIITLSEFEMLPAGMYHLELRMGETFVVKPALKYR